MDPRHLQAKASFEADEGTNIQNEESKASMDKNDDTVDTTLLYQNRPKKSPTRVEKPSPQKLQLLIQEVDKERHVK